LNAHKKSYEEVYDEIMSLDSLECSPFDNYKFFIKWEGLEYSYSTWEDQYIVFSSRDKLSKYFEVRKKKKTLKKLSITENLKKTINLTEKPSYIEGHLYDYQLKGMNWLINEYIKKNNSILLDEMGLGKEIQALCFLRYLTEELALEGPFLIVTLPSAINYWQRETLKWCPNLDVIIYGGDPASRRKINDYEFFNLKNKRQSQFLKPKFQIAITTFSSVNNEINKLKKIKWEIVIIDDAQKLKSNESKLYRLCAELKPNHKVVLSGAPGDSSVDEMVSLARYIIPNKTKMIEEIENISSILVVKPINSASRKINTTEAEKENALKKLSSLLEKHTLKRTAQDINFEFTNIDEKVIKITLTHAQRKLYKNVILKNSSLATLIEGGQAKQNSKNLKKNSDTLKYSLTSALHNLILVSNHINLYSLKNFNFELNNGKFEEEILDTSNKLKLFSKLVPKLLASNQKLLIYTQFPLVLDFIEQLLILLDLEYERIDGATRSTDKKTNIENFKKGLSRILIISAEVGDLGVELTSSEIIILMDSHLNIYKDIQDFCRALPKQKNNKLTIYRFLSKSTVEDRIVSNAFHKVLKNEVITNPFDQSKYDKGILESILKYNGKEFLEDINQNHNPYEITNKSINDIFSTVGKKLGKSQHIKIYDQSEFFVSDLNFMDIVVTPGDSNHIEDFKDLNQIIIEKPEDKPFINKNDINNEVSLEKQMSLEKIQNGIKNSLEQKSQSDISSNVHIKIPVACETPQIQNDSNDQNIKNSAMSIEYPNDKSLSQDEEIQKTLINYNTHLLLIFKEICNKGIDELSKMCSFEEVIRLKFLEFLLKYEVTPLTLEEFYKRYFFFFLYLLIFRFCQFMEPYSSAIKIPTLIHFKEYLKLFYSILLNGPGSSDVNKFFFFNVKVEFFSYQLYSN